MHGLHSQHCCSTRHAAVAALPPAPALTTLPKHLPLARLPATAEALNFEEEAEREEAGAAPAPAAEPAAAAAGAGGPGKKKKRRGMGRYIDMEAELSDAEGGGGSSDEDDDDEEGVLVGAWGLAWWRWCWCWYWWCRHCWVRSVRRHCLLSCSNAVCRHYVGYQPALESAADHGSLPVPWHSLVPSLLPAALLTHLTSPHLP